VPAGDQGKPGDPTVDTTTTLDIASTEGADGGGAMRQYG
jgi:hypothetical protein